MKDKKGKKLQKRFLIKVMEVTIDAMVAQNKTLQKRIKEAESLINDQIQLINLLRSKERFNSEDMNVAFRIGANLHEYQNRYNMKFVKPEKEERNPPQGSKMWGTLEDQDKEQKGAEQSETV